MASATISGAQTERWGLAGPVGDLLGGEPSPAALFLQRSGARPDSADIPYEIRVMTTLCLPSESLPA